MNTLNRSLALVGLGSACFVCARAIELPAPTTDLGYIPCKIHRSVSPVFPARLLHDGILRGEARLMLEIDTRGQITDSLITAYTHREFAEEVVRVVRYWRFEPGLIERRPVISTLDLTFNFENTGVVVVERHGPPSRPELPPGETYEYRAHGPSTLDRIPVAVSTPRPIYPKAWIEEGRVGAVTVTFFIDETGRTRLPVIEAQSDPFLAAAVVATVREWRFEPPTSHGRPVLARVQQTFDFDPKPEPTTNA